MIHRLGASAAFVSLLTFAAAPAIAQAGPASGHAALALAAIVGQYDPALPATTKLALLSLLSDKTVPPSKAGNNIVVSAEAITCQAGDVDIAAFACTLTFPHRSVSLSGRYANELYATLAEAGVPGDGAAGRIFEAVKTLNCTISPSGVAQKDGGGAT